jgi:L-ascorbate peroxidase
MLRLAFHDSGTYSVAAGDGGANGSVRLELGRPENTGLKRGWGVIEKTEAALVGTVAEGRVSQADLVALAGAYAVCVTGGPDIRVPVGEGTRRPPPLEPRAPAVCARARACAPPPPPPPTARTV